MKFSLKATGIGALATLAASLLFPPMGIFVLASIVCTAGIGLVVWIPVCFLIGYVILMVVRVWRGPQVVRPKATTGSTEVRVDHTLRMVADFIRRERMHEIARASIDQRLKEQGWTGDLIAEAHRIVDSELRVSGSG